MSQVTDTRRGMIPEDIAALRQAGEPQVSPDGTTVAFTVADPDVAANRYARRIWLAAAGDAVVSGAPASGTPVSGTPVSGTPVSGTPVSGTPVSGTPASGAARPFTGPGAEFLPRWSPDGRVLAFAATDADGGTPQVCTLPVGGGERLVVCATGAAATELEWSPNGTMLAFVARDPDPAQYGADGKQRQKDMPPRRISRLLYRHNGTGWTADRPSRVFVVPADGSAPPRAVTGGPFEASGLTWSPDSASIAFASGRHEAWDLDLATDLYTVPADGSREPEAVTGGGRGWSHPAWSPDGTALAAYLNPTPLESPRHRQVAVVDLASGKDQVLTAALDRTCAPFGTMIAPAWAGNRVLFGVEDRGNVHLYLVDADGTGAPELVAGGDRWITEWDWAGGTLAFVAATPVSMGELVARDLDPARPAGTAAAGGAGGSGTAGSGTAGSGTAGSGTAGSGTAGSGTAGSGTAGSGTAGSGTAGSGTAGSGTAGSGTAGSGTAGSGTAGSGTAGSGGPAERTLTSVMAALTARVALGAPQRFTAASEGGAEVECWVIPPAGAVPGTRYPTLLNVHGGPFTQYGNRLVDDFQLQAAAGFAVLYCNPRGSSGYTEHWGRAIRGPKADSDPGTGWGTVDFADVMACVDTACQQFDFIDPDQVGILGGSYGGYMTGWAIGHTDRFKAAISERACNNLLTMEHSADIAGFIRSYVGTDHLADPASYLALSPVTYAADMTTPVLILHSEDDLRCPIAQAEELFVALRRLGRDPVMYRFPAENHELTRGGAPRHRIMRAGLVLDWFRQHLADGAAAGG